MFIDYHLASLASGSLIAGYHQDVNLSAHLMTIDSCYVPVRLWHKFAMTSYRLLFRHPDPEMVKKYPKMGIPSKYVKFDTYEEWFNDHARRCALHKVDVFSGRSLYSTILPSDLEWSMDKCRVKNGILISGTMSSKTTSGSGSSVGLVVYRTYDAQTCVEWLNASYRMLNEYLIYRGSTLSTKDMELAPWQYDRIASLVAEMHKRADLLVETEKIYDPVIRTRKELAILQELNNLRDNIAVIAMKPSNPAISTSIKSVVDGTIKLYVKKYDVYSQKSHGADSNYSQYKSQSGICLNNDLKFPVAPLILNNGDKLYTFNVDNAFIAIDLYGGSILLFMKDDNNTQYYYPMNIVYRIEATLVQNGKLINIDRTFTHPNHLVTMIESGARGNSANVIQIIGVIGQNIYENGRLPRNMEYAKIMLGNGTIAEGRRSLPCFTPGENTPESRGFITTSLLQGVKIDVNALLHISARENLIANQDTTPDTGYFTRKLRTFMENIKIDIVNDKIVATNDKGQIVMMDYIFDPSRLFKIGNSTTFVDMNRESQSIRTVYGNYCIYINVPLMKHLNDYIIYYDIVNAAVEKYKDLNIKIDIIIALHHSIEYKMRDVYTYFKNEFAKEVNSINIITVIVPEKYGDNWYLVMDDYDSILVLPTIISKKARMAPDTIIPMIDFTGVKGTTIDIGSENIDRILIDNVIPENPLTERNIFDIMVYGSDFNKRPFIVKPSSKMDELIGKLSLFEVLTNSGPVYQAKSNKPKQSHLGIPHLLVVSNNHLLMLERNDGLILPYGQSGTQQIEDDVDASLNMIKNGIDIEMGSFASDISNMINYEDGIKLTQEGKTSFIFVINDTMLHTKYPDAALSEFMKDREKKLKASSNTISNKEFISMMSITGMKWLSIKTIGNMISKNKSTRISKKTFNFIKNTPAILQQLSL